MSALAVVTTPDGAEVFIDGESKGPAPLNLRLPVGAAVEVRATAPGHLAASQSVTVSARPATVRLTLAEVADAGAPQPPTTQSGHSSPPGGTRTRGARHGRDRGKGSGSGSGSNQQFNPNDVL